MDASSSRWSQVTPSRYTHEDTGYLLLGEILSDREPHRVWANFDFEGPDGAWHHVDALVLTGVGLFALDFLDITGRIEGNPQTWQVVGPDERLYTRSNPGPAARAKARALSATLQALRPDGAATSVVGLAVLVDEAFLPAALDVRRHVVGTSGEVTLETALREGRYPGAGNDEHASGNTTLAQQLDQAVHDGRETRIIRRADHYRRVGDWRLDELLFSSATFQDFRGHHVGDKRKTVRVRRFNVAATADDHHKRKVDRGARREYALLASLEHPGIAHVLEFKPTEFGPCLFFEDTPNAVRLDQYLARRGRSMSWDARVDFFGDLVSAVRYMHGKGVIHRALSPHSILVVDPDSDRPKLQIFSWQTGDRPEGTSRGTEHIEQLLEAEAQAFIAPEVAFGLEGDESADVFSLGVLACAVFAGRAPTDYQELHAQLRLQKGLRISAYGDHLPAHLEDAVFDATRGDAESRIQNLDELAERLTDAYAHVTRTTDDEEPNDPTKARAGDRLGPYRVEKVLGAGGSAVALLVRHADGDQVVLKIPRGLEDQARIRDEAEALGKLDHPNIVRCHGVVDVVDRPALVVDYAGRDTLRERLRQEVLGEELLENLGDDLLSALEHVIDRGELHRDLKPANLSLRTAGKPERLRLLLYDFSLAGVPRDHIRVGTAPYKDPFLGEPGRLEWDTFAEMYAAALVLHEMAAGVLPMWGDGRSAPATLDDEHPRIDPERFDPGIREALAEFFTTALHRDTGRRFPDVQRMREAWKAAFAEITSAHTEHPSQAPVTVDTPVGHLALSTRAINALDRMGVPTVGDLLRVPDHTLRFSRGLGAATRNEIRELRQRLAHLAEQAAKLDRPAPDTGPTVERLEDFLEVLSRGRKAAERSRRAYLGLDPLTPGQGPDVWPTAAEVAEVLEVTRANVSAHLAKDRQVWGKSDAVARLRTDLERLLDESGGVASPRQLGDALLGLWLTDETAEDERLRTACAVARLGVETEMTQEAPRFTLSRDRSGLVLVATDDSRVTWARKLGRKADEIAARDPLSAPARVADELRSLAGDEGLSSASLLRLAASFSSSAAVSSWQELYPRGMSAERAVALARNAVLTPGQRNQLAPISEADLRARVAARYPEAAPLPPRPELDAVVERASLPLRWDESQSAYVPKDAVRLIAGATASTHYTSTSYVGRPIPAVAKQDPEVRGFEERLRDAHEPGAWCVFPVATRHLVRAVDAFEGFPSSPRTISLDALLVRHLRGFAEEKRIKWARLLDADTKPEDSRDWQKLGLVVREAVERTVAEVLGTDTGGAPLLLRDAGLLAHYDQLAALDRIRGAVNSGAAGAPCAWVLIPNDDQRAVLDGRPLPTVTTAQVARVPGAWVRIQAASRGND